VPLSPSSIIWYQ